MNKIIKALIFMAISIGIMSIISIGIISLFSNIFVSSGLFVDGLFCACGMLTSIIVILGLRLMGKDIYKFIDNYKIKNLNYLLILFICLAGLFWLIFTLLVVFLGNYFLFLSNEGVLSFMNGVFIEHSSTIYFRLKGIDKYKEMMKYF